MFLFEGNRLDGNMTAEQYYLEPGDVIDHAVMQTGDLNAIIRVLSLQGWQSGA